MPDLDDRVRFALLARALSEQPLLVVLNDFDLARTWTIRRLATAATAQIRQLLFQRC
jgi:hypothetical protein